MPVLEQHELDALAAEYRKIGFTANAQFFPRNELAFLMICAFCGYDPKIAPVGLKSFPNEATQQAWERVADVALAYHKTKEDDNGPETE